MKLYVFQVNNGSTLTFDTDLAVQTVLELKHAIQSKYKISVQHQVLVVNGGECMSAERRVCSYSAGTETNPIFLFNKETILSERDPSIPKTTFSIESEIQVKVEESLLMPAVFHTVASRTQLALEMFEVANKLCSFCERLVHDEHLQHQGWAAIMANLDDCTLSYQRLLLMFSTAYCEYQDKLEHIKTKLTRLGTAVSVMARIPLLECLTRQSYKESMEKDEDVSTHSVLCATEALPPSSCSSSSQREAGKMTDSGSLRAALLDEDGGEPAGPSSFNVTLLDWINVQDRPNDVESVVRKCFDSINRLDPRIIQPFLVDCRDTVSKLDNQNMKAIKGLEDRLYALDQMIASCKKLVNEQKELAQGFVANQKRAENLKDTSVLPDLCLSHTNQLMIMLNNHRKLLDIKKKCTTAKQELANNLQVRLKWCCYVMLHADQDGEKLQALLRLLTELTDRVRVVEALSTVPQMYCLAVVEVVRRKMFMSHYREWAHALVKDGKKLYEAEKFKRESFGKLFKKSFLQNRLFRGLDSWPPVSFCTRRPRRFDEELPDISVDDLRYLKSCCPAEVQPFLMVPAMCDFQPLHHHVETLHQLVQATQSLDEMSQTITDLLTEHKASCSQSLQPSAAVTPQSDGPSRTPPPLSLQHPQAPVPLEDLSPDSIDAQTFDFETIGHPGLDAALQQGSLDLDSLVESPESDFMSAVNEFVIEENPASPTPVSEPASPEMMVESLYSSVINAIDSRRMQDTTTLERERRRGSFLRRALEEHRRGAEESRCSLSGLKLDLGQLRALVVRERQDFGAALHSAAAELQALERRHKDKLQSVRTELQRRLDTLEEENLQNQNIVHDVQRAMLELEGLMERKEKELSQLEQERERWAAADASHTLQIQDLERSASRQAEETERLEECRERLSGQLEALRADAEHGEQRIRQELEDTTQRRLQEAQREYRAELELMDRERQEALRRVVEQQSEEAELHAAALSQKNLQLAELQEQVASLTELRCRLEVELVLKESEGEELRHRLEETQQEGGALGEELAELRRRLQLKNQEYEVDLAELRSLMRVEKDHCISELVERHDEEILLLRSQLTALQQEAQQVEKLRAEAAARDGENQTQRRSFQEVELQLRTEIQSLQRANQQLSNRLQQEETPPPSSGEAPSPVSQEDSVPPASLDSALQQEASLESQLELLEKKKNEEIQNLKTSLIAEQQTNFNTVLTREKLKKEQIINELTEKLLKVTQQQEKDKALIETLSEDRASVMQEKKQLEEELNRLRTSALLSSTFLGPRAPEGPQDPETGAACRAGPLGAPLCESSVAPVTDDEQLDSAVEASMVMVHDHMMSEEKQRIILLERTLHMKEEENKRLSQRLMSQSMSSVSSRHSDKIAIRDFQVGDLVLIILDERHDNYVLFTVGPTLYFLHSESLTALDLKPASGSSRRPWVLGKVMEKEYCQAKKAQNRFKVPLGTKFYRVKAVPWNRKV